MIKGFRHKGLKRLFLAGNSRRIAAELRARALRRLDALDAAEAPEQLNVPGFDFHALRGKRRRYSIHVNGRWCITFEWEGGNAVRVDLEQYHVEVSMVDDPITKHPDRVPTHPGTILREDVFPALGVKIARAAKDLGVSRQTLHRILAEEAPVTPAMALRLGKFCGNGPGLWLNMQSKYDLWHLERSMKVELESIPRRAA